MTTESQPLSMDDLRVALSHLVHTAYENHVAVLARRWLRSKMGLSNVAAIAMLDDRIRLHAIINEAVDHGAISEAEADDLAFADLAFADLAFAATGSVTFAG